jgi:flagellar hook-basal body complex protein FliE
MSNIQNISQTFNLPKPHQVAPQPGEAQPSFGKFLLEGIQQVNEMQQDADRAVESLFTGGDVNPAEVLSAVQKAD